MFKKRLSLKEAIAIAFGIHVLVFVFFSIAAVKEFYPESRYLKVSLVSPSAIKYAGRDCPLPIEKASFQPNAHIPENFFCRIRRASLEISLTHPQGTTEQVKLASLPESSSGLALQALEPAGAPIDDKNLRKILHIATPEYQYWMRKIAVEKKIKLKVHLTPDGRVSWIELNTSSGDPELDALIKTAVSRWQFGTPYQND